MGAKPVLSCSPGWVPSSAPVGGALFCPLFEAVLVGGGSSGSILLNAASAVALPKALLAPPLYALATVP
jgi:hypothetical protein